MITLEKGQTLLGHNAVGLRDFLIYVGVGSIPPQKKLDRVGVSTDKEYDNLVQLLVDNGYLEVEVKVFGKKEYTTYEATDKGRELCRAKCMKRMTRDKANEVYEGILSRVAEVNNNPYYLYKITNFVVFGSFITDKETLGDIDISYELEFKGSDGEGKNGFNAEQTANRKRAREKNCIDFFASLSYGRHEVEKAIKNRSPKIHIIPFIHLEGMGCTTKTVKL
jgi:hypothetical protein